MRIECSRDAVYTSSTATASYLKESGIDNIYVIGSNGFRDEIENEGIRIVDNNFYVGCKKNAVELVNYKIVATL